MADWSENLHPRDTAGRFRASAVGLERLKRGLYESRGDVYQPDSLKNPLFGSAHGFEVFAAARGDIPATAKPANTLTKAETNALPAVEVDPAELIHTQNWLRPIEDKFERKKGAGHSAAGIDPVVTFSDGAYYIWDGHHRVADAVKRGKSSIRVRVYDKEHAVPIRKQSKTDLSNSEHVPSSGRKDANWVSKTGGLPEFINRIAKDLMEKGMSESHAIATAVNQCKKWAAGGKGVKPQTRAKAAAAVAEWEAKKAASHVGLSVPARLDSGRHARLRTVDLSSVLERAAQIDDPARRATARLRVLDLVAGDGGRAIASGRSYSLDELATKRALILERAAAKAARAKKKAAGSRKTKKAAGKKSKFVAPPKRVKPVTAADLHGGGGGQPKWAHGWVPLNDAAKAQVKANPQKFAKMRKQQASAGRSVANLSSAAEPLLIDLADGQVAFNIEKVRDAYSAKENKRRQAAYAKQREQRALNPMVDLPVQVEPRYRYPKEVWNTHLIVKGENDAELFKVPYSVGSDGVTVTFGKEVPVTQQYVELSHADESGLIAEWDDAGDRIMTIDLADAKPGQRFRHGWIPINSSVGKAIRATAKPAARVPAPRVAGSRKRGLVDGLTKAQHSKRVEDLAAIPRSERTPEQHLAFVRSNAVIRGEAPPTKTVLPAGGGKAHHPDVVAAGKRLAGAVAVLDAAGGPGGNETFSSPESRAFLHAWNSYSGIAMAHKGPLGDSAGTGNTYARAKAALGELGLPARQTAGSTGGMTPSKKIAAKSGGNEVQIGQFNEALSKQSDLNSKHAKELVARLDQLHTERGQKMWPGLTSEQARSRSVQDHQLRTGAVSVGANWKRPDWYTGPQPKVVKQGESSTERFRQNAVDQAKPQADMKAGGDKAPDSTTPMRDLARIATTAGHPHREAARVEAVTRKNASMGRAADGVTPLGRAPGSAPKPDANTSMDDLKRMAATPGHPHQRRAEKEILARSTTPTSTQGNGPAFERKTMKGHGIKHGDHIEVVRHGRTIKGTAHIKNSDIGIVDGEQYYAMGGVATKVMARKVPPPGWEKAGGGLDALQRVADEIKQEREKAKATRIRLLTEEIRANAGSDDAAQQARRAALAKLQGASTVPTKGTHPEKFKPGEKPPVHKFMNSERLQAIAAGDNPEHAAKAKEILQKRGHSTVPAPSNVERGQQSAQAMANARGGLSSSNEATRALTERILAKRAEKNNTTPQLEPFGVSAKQVQDNSYRSGLRTVYQAHDANGNPVATGFATREKAERAAAAMKARHETVRTPQGMPALPPGGNASADITAARAARGQADTGLGSPAMARISTQSLRNMLTNQTTPPAKRSAIREELLRRAGGSDAGTGPRRATEETVHGGPEAGDTTAPTARQQSLSDSVKLVRDAARMQPSELNNLSSRELATVAASSLASTALKNKVNRVLNRKRQASVDQVSSVKPPTPHDGPSGAAETTRGRSGLATARTPTSAIEKQSVLQRIVNDKSALEVGGVVVDMNSANIVNEILKALSPENRKKMLALPFHQMMERGMTLYGRVQKK